MRAILMLITALLALPVLGVLGAWGLMDAQALDLLTHQWQTVLPGYSWQSLQLVLGVALGVAVVGGASAVMVTLFDFRGRRFFEWALLLPLALPAYVLAYAYTDALQFSGPIQTALRAAWGRTGPLWPDVRSLGGAVLLFIFCLYPYVYLLTRTALADQAGPVMEAARLLGAPMRRRLLEVALPMARPALAAGVALALMETLADYGVGAYFGLSTFTTGIYRAWLVMDDRLAAAQLASVLLLVVGVLLVMEQRAQSRMRFANSRVGVAGSLSSQPAQLGWWGHACAWVLCGVPVLLGFVAPVAWLLRQLWLEAHTSETPVFVAGYLSRFGDWAWASFRLAGCAAGLAVLLALALGFTLRRHGADGAVWLRGAARLLMLGYAVPGAVVAVGVLMITGVIQQWAPQWGVPLLVTGTAFGLMVAYLTRFSAVALQSIQAGYAKLPPSLDETALLLGADARRTWWAIHLPLLARSALAATLLVFVDAMKELPATLVLRPFGSDTLAVVAYQFARDERLAEAALPSLAIVAVGLIPVLMLSRALRK